MDNIYHMKRIHHSYEHWLMMRKLTDYPELLKTHPMIGKWHHLYASKKGKISLISLPNYFHNGVTLWEICGSMTPNHNIERFASQEEAEARIKELLE